MSSNASPPTLPSPPELAENKRRALNAIKAYLNKNEKNKSVANLKELINTWGNNNKLAGMTSNNTTKIELARTQLNALRGAAVGAENAKATVKYEPTPENIEALRKARIKLTNAVTKLENTTLGAMSPETQKSLYDVIKSELTPRPGYVNRGRAFFGLKKPAPNQP